METTRGLFLKQTLIKTTPFGVPIFAAKCTIKRNRKSLVICVARANFLESVSTGLWCVPGFGAAFVFALEPPELQKKKPKILRRATFIFCAKPWHASNPGPEEI